MGICTGVQTVLWLLSSLCTKLDCRSCHKGPMSSLSVDRIDRNFSMFQCSLPNKADIFQKLLQRTQNYSCNMMQSRNQRVIKLICRVSMLANPAVCHASVTFAISTLIGEMTWTFSYDSWDNLCQCSTLQLVKWF